MYSLNISYIEIFNNYLMFKMPSYGPAFSHEECRGRICCACGIKLSKLSVMSVADETLLKNFGPHPTYDREISSYPVGICPSCKTDLYKVKSGKVPKNWSDNKSPRWSKFHIDLIYGVRTCGVLDSNGISRLCDICLHVRSNPIGSTLSKKEANKPKILIPRGTEEPKMSLKNSSEHNQCGNCLGEKRPGVPHPCGPSS